jgi:hypothetical protein
LRRSVAEQNVDSKAVAEASTQEIVTFYNDRPGDTKDIPLPTSIPAPLLQTIGESFKHSIIDFLQRPVRAAVVSWGTGSTALTELVHLDLPADYLTNQMVARKVEGFVGIRATCVVRVVLNAQRFQQGRLLLTYFPQGQVNPYRMQQSKRSLTLATQLPRVEMDCATSTEAILRIPYVSTTTHYNIVDDSGPNGDFHLLVYSPLVAPTGSSTADIAVYTHLEDIDLEFPTYAVPQMDSTPPADGFDDVIADVQVGNISESEAAPISSTLGKVAKVATAISGIPTIGSFAKGVAWAAATAAKVASTLGWSKPNDNAAVTFVKQVPYKYSTNVMGKDHSTNLAFMPDNQVEAMSIGPTQLDEMSFDYVKRIPAYFKTVSWSTSEAVDTVLYSLDNRPINYSADRLVATSVTNKTVYDCVPFAYVANFFHLWRGSVTITLKFVKTEFHTGRLLIWFRPGTLANPTTTEMSYIHRDIVDLKTANEYTFTIPWAAPTEWLQVKHMPSGTVTFQDTNGRWGITVLSPLVAPATVSTSISILVEASAGPDFELAMPQSSPALFPLYEIPAIGGMMALDGEEGEEVVADVQGVGELLEEREKTGTITTTVDPIGGSDLHSPGLACEKYTVGESFRSIRSLMKRFCLWAYFDNAQSWSCWRPSFPTPSTIVPGNDIVLSGFYYDPITIFGPMYAYRRGGMRLKVHKRGTTEVNQTVYALQHWFPTTTGFTAKSAGNPFSSLPPDSHLINVCFPSLEGGTEVQVPHYSMTHSNINFMNSELTALTSDPRYLQMNGVVLSASTNWNSNTFAHVMRAGADDLDYGFFVGVLPLTASSNVVTGTNAW